MIRGKLEEQPSGEVGGSIRPQVCLSNSCERYAAMSSIHSTTTTTYGGNGPFGLAQASRC